jgi:hypothetical protein
MKSLVLAAVAVVALSSCTLPGMSVSSTGATMSGVTVTVGSGTTPTVTITPTPAATVTVSTGTATPAMDMATGAAM